MVQNIKEISSEHTGLPSQFGYWKVDQCISALSVTVPRTGSGKKEAYSK
jgi:hypothetical protein